MSLQVWLPLNGKWDNQGIFNLGTYNRSSQMTFDSAGLAGQCAIFNNSYLQITDPISTSAEEFTIALWFKQTTSGPAALWNSRVTTGKAVAIFIANNHIRFDDDSSQSATSDTLSLNTWYHVACTWKKGGKKRIYINGVQALEANAGSITTKTNTLASIGKSSLNGATPSGNAFAGLIQDFRIYDHCLSAREVHEISKGLVLHYKLDSIGGRDGNPNIIKNTVSMQLNNSTSDVNTGVWRLAGTNTMTRSRVSIEDSPIGPCYGLQNAGQQTTTSDASCYGINSVPRVVGTTYTASFYARVVSGGPTAQVGFSFYSVTVIGGTSTKKWASYNMTEITTQWKRCTYTYTSTSSSANIYIGVGTDGVNTTTQICGFKIEEGSVATPWCPNSSDPEYTSLGYNSNVVSDCSGYGNDGTANNVAFSSDAVIYNGSSTFNGTNSYITVNNKAGKVTDEITVSCWAYSANWLHNFRLLSCTESGGWSFSQTNTSGNLNLRATFYANGGYKYSNTVTSLTAGWHHFVSVWDGYKSVIYVDGENKGNNTAALTTKTPITYANNYIQIGAESAGNTTTPASGSYFNGRISDVRIYGKAFTDSEVKDLYETRASITDGGSMLSGEFDEVDTNTKIKQNFITQTNQFIEYHNPMNEYLYTGNTYAALQSDTFTTSYTPGTGTDSCGCTIGYWRISKPGIYWLEYDISFSGFTGVNSNGTFKIWTQGISRNATTGAHKWSGTNYFSSATTSHLVYGSKHSDVTDWAKAGGSYHVAFAVEFTQDMLNSVNGGGFQIRSDYSDGKGKVTISNPKIYEDKYKNRQGITKFYSNSDITSVEFVEI